MTTLYNALIEFNVREDPDDTILEGFADYHGVVSATPRHTLEVTFSFPAENMRQATATALAVAYAAYECEPRSIHVLTSDDFDQRLGLEPILETLSVPEAAQILGTSTQNVQQRLNRGTLPGTRVGRDWRLPRAEIEHIAAKD